MPTKDLTRFLLLPKLKLIKFEQWKNRILIFHCETTTSSCICPHCKTKTTWIHDRRTVKIKDSPHNNKEKWLYIKKKRFRCSNCKKVFTEPVSGIMKRSRLTERLQRNLLYCCDKYANLSAVRNHFKLANKTIYKRHYNQLELEWRKRKNDPWPKTIGIDEHSFIRNKKYGHREFVTMIVDYKNKRLKEVVPGRTIGQLGASLEYIKGRENVTNVVMDLSTTYRSFVTQFFPNATVIADKFHVIRLAMPILNRYRKMITGDKRKLGIRKLLLKNSKKIDPFLRHEIMKWLDDKPQLKEVYLVKEALLKLYRCKGRRWAKRVLTKLTDSLTVSKLPELQTLRKTLIKWRMEILNYFGKGITNARTEGFNNVAKQVQKRAYGFKSFYNYRLKLLYACR